MAEKGSRETRGKDGRPVTLPALYELLQQWQPPEEGDETSGPSTPTTPTGSARNHRRRRRSITRARSESEELQSSEQLGSWLWVEPTAQHSASRSRRASRRRSLVSGDAGSSHHHHHDRDQVAEPLVRLLQRALRALHLRRHHSRRMHCDSLATQAQLPASNNSSLFPTAAPPPGSAEEVQQLDEQANAEHRAWMREMRHRARHLLAMPEPEPFWLPHMLGEGADADTVAAAASASATAATAASATSAANAAAAIERPRQLWSSTRSWSHTTSDLNDAATSCSDSASDSIITTTSSSSSEQDATERNKDLPSQEKK